MKKTEASESDQIRKKALLAGVLYMGLSHIIFLKQYVKGILFFLIESLFLFFALFQVHSTGLYLSGNGPLIQAIKNMVTLGGDQSDLPVREREHAMFLLNDGLLAIVLIIVFLMLYYLSVRDVIRVLRCRDKSGHMPRLNKTSIRDKTFFISALMPTYVLLLLFVVLPLIFSALIAFTDYSAPNHMPPAQRVNWVGLENFTTLFSGGQEWTASFGRVALWTLLWAFLATGTTFIGGFVIALVLRSHKIRLSRVFQSIFILPYAVPSLISMMIWANLLNGTIGPVNTMLHGLGMTESVYWLTDPVMARISMVVVNLWLGFPYYMMMTTSIMTSISQDIFEASAVDGASQWQTAVKITLPLVMQQAVPLLIMSFCTNLNNFGMAFFLTVGGPSVAGETTITKAGATDILISWIYKLTNEAPQKYQYASVLAVLIFAVITPFAVYNYMRSKSFKESDM